MNLTEEELQLLDNEKATGETLYSAYKAREYDKMGSVEENKKIAVVLLRGACERGHGKSLFTLSTKFKSGDVGVPKDPIIAGRLLRRSADAGFHKAAFVMFGKLSYGSPEDGVEKDSELSDYYLKIAAGYKEVDDERIGIYSGHGYPKAQKLAAMKHLYGDYGFEKSQRIYLNLLNHATRNGKETGDEDAQKELFFIVMRGKSRRMAIAILGTKKVEGIRSHLAENMPSHHPIFKNEFPRELLTEFKEKQAMKKRYPQFS